jgi:hypothetical protein
VKLCSGRIWPWDKTHETKLREEHSTAQKTAKWNWALAGHAKRNQSKEKKKSCMIIHRDESKLSLVGWWSKSKRACEEIYCISVRNPPLCLPSNPPVMCGGNPSNILTPVYSINVLGDLLRQSATSHSEYCTSPTWVTCILQALERNREFSSYIRW